MKVPLLFLASVATLLTIANSAAASDRYATRPPVVMSPDLAAPWVMQLQKNGNGAVAVRPSVRKPKTVQRDNHKQKKATAASQRRKPAAAGSRPSIYREAAFQRPVERPAKKPRNQLDPQFLPQTVAYSGPEKPGTIVVDTRDKFLYHVEDGGTARRYGVGVGKEGFEWNGTNTISRKAEWPSWRPPAAMIARERRKGRILPVHMEGGPANPLGARALYLGSTLYRIHGTNQPWTIGKAVSSGCIRMRNEDVTELYDRVKIGAKVIVR
ncbi:MAG: L,D-transpeptidase [Phyllobacterium sp.]